MLYYIRLIVKLLIIIITLILFYKKLIKKNSSRKEKENSHTIEDEKKLRKKPSSPLLIGIYKGEGRILIVPCVRHIGGFYVNSHNTLSIDYFSDNQLIGQSIIDVIKYIKNSPEDVSTPYDREKNPVWKENTKYKSKTSFYKNNHRVNIQIFEDGTYDVYSLYRYDDGYGDVAKKITLPSNATKEEIGSAIIDVFDYVEKYGNVSTKEFKKNIQLLNNSIVTFNIPSDTHFVDSEDFGAMEIYQGYSYIVNETSDSSAEIFLGMAAELDCNLQSDNIKDIWQGFDGKAEYFEVNDVNFGIFKLKVEFKNKNIHRISYFLRIDENELLECGLQVHQPNRRKKLDEKLVKIFEDFALSCKR